MTNSSSFLASLEAEKVPSTDNVENTPQVVENPVSIVTDLVGEGKRFSDMESLAKAKLESDRHIERVEAENKALREKYDSMDNNYNAILKKLEETSTPTNVSMQDKDANVASVDVSKLVEEALSTREKELQKKANLKNSWDKLSQVYGNLENAKQAIEDAFKEKPYMTKVIDELAFSNPDLMVKEVISMRNPESFSTSKAGNPIDNLNTQIRPPEDNSTYLTWSEARKVMFSDPKKYSSKEYSTLIKASAAHYKSKGIDFYSQT